MTDDLTSRQRRGLDMADAAPEDATDDNLDALLELTRHPDSDVRADAAQAVKTITANQPGLVAPRLHDAIGLLHSHDLDVRTFGQGIVGLLGSKRPDATEATTAAHHLAQGLTDENEFVRMNAAETIGTVGEVSPELFAHPGIVDALVGKVESDDRGATRGHAAQSLATIGTADPSVIDDGTVERLEAVLERGDGVGGRIESAIDAVTTAKATRGANAGDKGETEFCPACGVELDADPTPNFCRNCGQEL
jgi:HEAT repeat protein